MFFTAGIRCTVFALSVFMLGQLRALAKVLLDKAQHSRCQQEDGDQVGNGYKGDALLLAMTAYELHCKQFSCIYLGGFYYV